MPDTQLGTFIALPFVGRASHEEHYRMKRLAFIILLGGCAPGSLETTEGCPIGLTDIGIARQQACQAAYYEEQARLNGQRITRCTTVGNTTTCIEG